MAKVAKKASAKPKGIQPSDHRNRAPNRLSKTVNKLTKSFLGRQGFIKADVVNKWPVIVGEKMARHTLPEKLQFGRDGASDGTLHLRCDSGAFAMELMHQEPQILDRLNTYFGYQAVVRVKLIQSGPLPHPKYIPPTQPRPLSKSESKDLDSTTQRVENEDLRQALSNLGKYIVRRD